MTNQQGAPEALRLANSITWMDAFTDFQRDELDKAAAELRRLHAENVRLAALVEAQQPTTHVQNPAEIAHIAGDVSKNGPESNMAQQPVPSAAAAGQHFCPGIPRPECNYLAQCESVCNKCGKLHSTRFLEDRLPAAAARRWSTYEQAIADPVFQTARSIMGTENIGQDRQLVKAINHVIDSQPSPTPQADSQPAPVRGKLLPCPCCGGEAAEHDRFNSNTVRCLSCGLRVKQSEMGMGDAAKRWNSRAARAPADSVLEDAARYRWLRINAIGAFRTNDGKGPVSVYHLSKIPPIPGIPEETDAAIDAARKQGGAT